MKGNPRSTLFAVLVCLLVATAVGCSTPRTAVQPPPAYLFCSYKAPLFFDVPEGAEGVQADFSRTGSGTAASFTVPFTYGAASIGWGDASLSQAVRDAKLKKMKYADYSQLSILGIYNEIEILPHGE
jgi:hypothetical protein